MSNELFKTDLKILNVGTPLFKSELERQNLRCAHVDWKPVAGGNMKIINALDNLMNDPEIDEANKLAIDKVKKAQAVWIDIDKAINVIPGMDNKTILHAGPPIEYERMCGPVKGAIAGALIYEGLASNEEEADALAKSGEIKFAPCHRYNAVGPMAGIISPSMPVHVVKNVTEGNYAYATINEGLGKVLRFGANSIEVIDRLKYIEKEFAPSIRKLVKKMGGIDIKNITAQALHMGDECHNRNKAATALLLKELLPYAMEEKEDREKMTRAMSFIKNNEHYFLNLSMPACKCALESAQGIEKSTIVTTMARNGVDFGIRVSGMDKEDWFVGESQFVNGLLFPGFAEDDACRDLGDSAITETMGIGGFSMAASPSIVQFVGGKVTDAFNYSKRMYEITESENPNYSLPTLDFRGAPMGIDIRKVIEKGILPVINTGIAHKKAGVGQIGAGIVHPPVECFEKAILAFNEKYYK